jgi:hypothetical protein
MKDYEMTQVQLDALLDSMKPVPLVAMHCGMPKSPQARANSAWEMLGKEMGFKHMTVVPNGKGDRFFRAKPTIKY